jgi:hypothetical protein
MTGGLKLLKNEVLSTTLGPKNEKMKVELHNHTIHNQYSLLRTVELMQ